MIKFTLEKQHHESITQRIFTPFLQSCSILTLLERFSANETIMSGSACTTLGNDVVMVSISPQQTAGRIRKPFLKLLGELFTMWALTNSLCKRHFSKTKNSYLYM